MTATAAHESTATATPEWLIPLTEACAYIARTYATASRMADDGRLAAMGLTPVRVGDSPTVRRVDLEALLGVDLPTLRASRTEAPTT